LAHVAGPTRNSLLQSTALASPPWNELTAPNRPESLREEADWPVRQERGHSRQSDATPNEAGNLAEPKKRKAADGDANPAKKSGRPVAAGAVLGLVVVCRMA